MKTRKQTVVAESPPTDWRKVAEQLADALTYTYHAERVGSALVVLCSRCRCDVTKHIPEQCEVAAALSAFENARGGK